MSLQIGFALSDQPGGHFCLFAVGPDQHEANHAQFGRDGVFRLVGPERRVGKPDRPITVPGND